MVDITHLNDDDTVSSPTSSKSPTIDSSAEPSSHKGSFPTPPPRKRSHVKSNSNDTSNANILGSHYESDLTPSAKRRMSLASHVDHVKQEKHNKTSPNLSSTSSFSHGVLPPLAPISKPSSGGALDLTTKHMTHAIAPKPPNFSPSTAKSKQSSFKSPGISIDRHSSLSPDFGPTGKSSILPSPSSSSTSANSSNAPDPSNSFQSSNNAAFSRPRPIRSCTHCRQQKIKCNALEVFPAPCDKCANANRKCVVDPHFKPHKGGQVQSLRDDISSLKQQLAALKQRESVLASALEKTAVAGSPDAVAAAAAAVLNLQQQQTQAAARSEPESSSDNSTLKQLLNSTTAQLASNNNANSNLNSNSNPTIQELNSGVGRNSNSSNTAVSNNATNTNNTNLNSLNNLVDSFKSVATPPEKQSPNPSSNYSRQTSVSDSDTRPEYYIVGDVRISHDQAEELHQRFMNQYLPFLPIIQSNSAAELYQQSQLLFWTVCLTASLSEPTPTLYNSLCLLIKQLAIETCWIQTPRSTHIVQALLILGNWPLPNEKVLDDCSYRFIALTKSLAMQLGLHRGKFIYEFSRTQVSLPDAEKWRTRTWIAIFVMEQVWCANLGLPPNMPMDYLLEQARTDLSLPKSFRSLVCLAMFCSKLVNLMGSSVTSPDGTLEPKNRFSTLGILEQELDRLVGELGTDDVFVEIYSLYLKMMICVFSFLPETPIQDQTIYIIKAYHAATRVVTLFSGLAEKRRIIEYPIYIRHSVSLAGFILFRLHLSPLLLPQYVESARQSVVTVHRLFRNMLTAWKDVQNDISRTAKILEKLNFVIITHPELFTKASGIITRMRSHLTASLFYELIWAIHEARRRGGIGSSVTHTAAFVAARAAAVNNNGANGNTKNNSNNNNNNNNGDNTSLSFDSINSVPGSHVDSVPPLPFYNQITKEDFTTTTMTTPNGTTVTTLVPTNANSVAAQYGGGSTIIYGSNGVKIYTNGTNGGAGSLEESDGLQGPPTGDNGHINNSGVQGVTKLAGIGNPSTMLATGGPDAAGSLTPNNSNSDDKNDRDVIRNANVDAANSPQLFVPIHPLDSASVRVGQITDYSESLINTPKGGLGDLSASASSIQATQTQMPAPSSSSPTASTLPQQLNQLQHQNQHQRQHQHQHHSQQQQQQQQHQQSLNGFNSLQNGNQHITPFYGTTGSSSDPLHLDTLMQGIDWLDPKGDDLLGWMDNFDLDM